MCLAYQYVYYDVLAWWWSVYHHLSRDEWNRHKWHIFDKYLMCVWHQTVAGYWWHSSEGSCHLEPLTTWLVNNRSRRLTCVLWDYSSHLSKMHLHLSRLELPMARTNAKHNCMTNECCWGPVVGLPACQEASLPAIIWSDGDNINTFVCLRWA